MRGPREFVPPSEAAVCASVSDAGSWVEDSGSGAGVLEEEESVCRCESSSVAFEPHASGTASAPSNRAMDRELHETVSDERMSEFGPAACRRKQSRILLPQSADWPAGVQPGLGAPGAVTFLSMLAVSTSTTAIT